MAETPQGYKTTRFTFFKNTPLVSFDKFLHFKDNAQRDDVMLNQKPYETKVKDLPFNFVNDRLTVRMSGNYADWKGYNYCTFISEMEPDTRYYAFISRTEYANGNNTIMYLIIDVGMTFLQGKVLEQLGQGVNIEREHLDSNGWANNRLRLLTNDDVLETSTAQYVFNKIHKFNQLLVLFTTTTDLSTKWGTWDAPTMETSKGATYDGITSPQNIYCDTVNRFLAFTKEVSKAPWIARQITKIILIPAEFVDTSDFEEVGVNGGSVTDMVTINKVKNGKTSKNYVMEEMSLDLDTLFNITGFDRDRDDDLFRGQYFKLELYDWGGQKVVLDAPQLPDDGLSLNVQTTLGFNNEIAVYPIEYSSRKEIYHNGVARGTYLNNALIFKDFDDVPILIDNALMAKASNAYTRQYENSKTITGATKMALDGSQSMQDRFFAGASVLQPIASAGLSGAKSGGAGGALAGVAGSLYTSFSGEWDYYRKQKAGLKDLEITSPTLTTQSSGHAFQIANDVYGVTLKIGVIDQQDRDKVRAYHDLFGYQMDTWGYLHSVDSMKMMNYVRFTGNFNLDNIHTALMTQLKGLIGSGVQLWHWTGNPNPFKDNIKMNKRVE